MKTKRTYRIFIFAIFTFSILLSQSCITSRQENETMSVIVSNSEGNGFSFELNFVKGKAHHYPLMAVWLEDASGNYLQTLFVARSVAKGEYDHADASLGKWKSGPLRRAATLPYWAHKYNTSFHHEDVFPSPLNPFPDAYSGATPVSNFILQSKSDSPLKKPFRVWFEINQFFDFNNFWTNNKFPDDADYKTSGQPALVYASDLINPEDLPKTLNLRLMGHSHFSGKDGGLYISLETFTSAKQIVKEITVTVKK